MSCPVMRNNCDILPPMRKGLSCVPQQAADSLEVPPSPVEVKVYHYIHLPRLPTHDEKIILRPQGELCLDRWTHSELAGALWSAAGSTTNDREGIIFRLRPLQNLPIISTPQSHVVNALYMVRELRLDERVYPITTYLSAPDNS
ncbi:hypothetical protein HPB51_029148 [Rhipicephalus microplus]|uniref:Uncharacterized protein n=1 Tax=Rhipicephalus microplus TaxID=6941 RepID=A0A9J6CVG9_RHIMP|nr:hypothetical protein HPB51_029148 [Rhipicephalus microplus]